MQVTLVSEEEQILTVTIAQKTVLKDLYSTNHFPYESNKQAYR